MLYKKFTFNFIPNADDDLQRFGSTRSSLRTGKWFLSTIALHDFELLK